MDKLTQVFVIAGAIRVLVPTVSPLVVDTLALTVEILTPINSFGTLKEAFYFLNNGLNLYDGLIITIPPLYVVLMLLFNWGAIGSFVYHVLFAAVDLWLAYRAVALNRWYNERQSERLGRPIKGFSDDLIASFVLFNPLVLLTCLSHLSLPIQVALTVELVYQVCIKRSLSRSAIALGVAAYIGFTPVYLLPCILALGHLLRLEDPQAVYVHGFALFTMTAMLLVLLLVAITGLVQFLQCYSTVIWGDMIAPNTGLWWYIFTEMFEFFTPFYTAIFNVYHFFFIVPITTRLFEFLKPLAYESMGVSQIAMDENGKLIVINPDGSTSLLEGIEETGSSVTRDLEEMELKQRKQTETTEDTVEETKDIEVSEQVETVPEKAPEKAPDYTAYNGDSLLAVVLCMMWLSFSKSYPVMGDLGYCLLLLPIFKDTAMAHSKYLFPLGLTFVVCLLLSPIFHYCWIVLGNGNSNFFYSINLIWGVVHAMLLMDIIWGKLCFDYEIQHKLTPGEISELQLTQI